MGKSGKYVKWICIILGVALLACAVLIGAVRSSKENEDWHYINGHYYDYIYCYADFVNPDTGEPMYRATDQYYKTIQLQYTGCSKELKFVFKQNHDDKPVKVDSYQISIRRLNPNTGKYEMQKEMIEVGEYRIGISNLLYNTKKFDIDDSIKLKIIIKE